MKIFKIKIYILDNNQNANYIIVIKPTSVRISCQLYHVQHLFLMRTKCIFSTYVVYWDWTVFTRFEHIIIFGDKPYVKELSGCMLERI